MLGDSGADIDDAGANPRIEAHPSRDGLRLVDPIEKSQFTLLTPESVQPEPCDTEAFYFPVDTAARVRTTELETPYLVDVWIRDTGGDLLAQSTDESSVSVPPGQYNVEISSAEMKLYLAGSFGLEIEPKSDCLVLDFTATDSITIGVRSLHEQPAATITTTEDPEDLLAAISTFGSALKTTTCERSFPTLRGHPPLLEHGDTLDIPEELDSPETGIRIEVPPQYEYVYPVASLAYYLGADVVPGPEPRLVADGETFSLMADGDFESTVGRIIKHVFLLDCVTRTEGYYTVDLHEREVVEERVDLDFASLYDEPLAEQVRTYLSVPYKEVEAAVPRWKLTADVIPVPEHAEVLPFLANELAIVRCPDLFETERRTAGEQADFGSSEIVDTALSGLARSRSSQNGPFIEDVFRLKDAPESIEQTYVGEGIPLGASKMTVDAYYRRLEYEPSESARTSIIVVCNEEEMADENVVSDIYGTREWLEFDITIKQNLTTEEMADVLRTDADFLHYIGHVDEEGIRCSDGWLDTWSLTDVNVTSFILNACKSYRQGRGLIDNGSVGGVVTVTDMLNKTATKLGKTLAQLLDSGFSLSTSLELLSSDSLIASNYVVVGDVNTQIVESQTGAPYRATLEETTAGFRSRLDLYPSRNYGTGSMVCPKTDIMTSNLLVGNRTPDFEIENSKIHDFLEKHAFPVEYDGDLLWSHELSANL